MKRRILLLLTMLLGHFSISAGNVIPGAWRTGEYFPQLEGKRFALVLNQTSEIQGVNLADSLCHAGLTPAFLFAPEHGFRGTEDAGASIKDGLDSRTGLTIHSLYGKEKKPSAALLKGLDCLVFDIQDTGCRFYTYLSTLHYVMEACAEAGLPLIVLDRPNPNDYVDGPVLDPAFRSFVGMHPIPLLHGCTLGEMARMINGQGWLAGGLSCPLTVIRVEGWAHGQPYSLPIKPSPNLPNDHAIRLYPSLCLFEGTTISVGRGTYTPFEVIGAPDSRYGDFRFRPVSLPGFDTRPLHQDKTVYGIDLRTDTATCGFSLTYLMEMYRRGGQNEAFFTNARFFDLLSGSSRLREQLMSGLDETVIRQSWAEELEAYRQMRQTYLLYPEP